MLTTVACLRSLLEEQKRKEVLTKITIKNSNDFHEREIAVKCTEIQRLQNELEETSARNINLAAELDQCRYSVTDSLQKVAASQQCLVEMRSQIQKYELMRKDYDYFIAQLTGRAEATFQQLQTTSKEWSQHQSAWNMKESELNHELNKSKSAVAQLKSQLSSAQQEIEQLKGNIADAGVRFDGIKRDLLESSSRYNDLLKTSRATEDDLFRINHKLDEALQDALKVRSELSQVEQVADAQLKTLREDGETARQLLQESLTRTQADYQRVDLERMEALRRNAELETSLTTAKYTLEKLSADKIRSDEEARRVYSQLEEKAKQNIAWLQQEYQTRIRYAEQLEFQIAKLNDASSAASFEIQTLKGDLKSKDDNVKAAANSAELTISSLKSQVISLTGEKSTLSSQLTSSEMRIFDMEQELKVLELSKNELEIELRRANGTIEANKRTHMQAEFVYQEQLKAYHQQAKYATQQLQEKAREADAVAARLFQLDSASAAAASQNKAKVEELQRELQERNVKLNDTIMSLRRETEAKDQVISAHKIELTDLTESMQRSKNHAERLERENNDILQQLQSAVDTKDSVEVQLMASKETIVNNKKHWERCEDVYQQQTLAYHQEVMQLKAVVESTNLQLQRMSENALEIDRKAQYYAGQAARAREQLMQAEAAVACAKEIERTAERKMQEALAEHGSKFVTLSSEIMEKDRVIEKLKNEIENAVARLNVGVPTSTPSTSSASSQERPQVGGEEITMKLPDLRSSADSCGAHNIREHYTEAVARIPGLTHNDSLLSSRSAMTAINHMSNDGDSIAGAVDLLSSSMSKLAGSHTDQQQEQQLSERNSAQILGAASEEAVAVGDALDVSVTSTPFHSDKQMGYDVGAHIPEFVGFFEGIGEEVSGVAASGQEYNFIVPTSTVIQFAAGESEGAAESQHERLLQEDSVGVEEEELEECERESQYHEVSGDGDVIDDEGESEGGDDDGGGD